MRLRVAVQCLSAQLRVSAGHHTHPWRGSPSDGGSVPTRRAAPGQPHIPRRPWASGSGASCGRPHTELCSGGWRVQRAAVRAGACVRTSPAHVCHCVWRCELVHLLGRSPPGTSPLFSPGSGNSARAWRTVPLPRSGRLSLPVRKVHTVLAPLGILCPVRVALRMGGRSRLTGQVGTAPGHLPVGCLYLIFEKGLLRSLAHFSQVVGVQVGSTSRPL